MSGNPDPLKVAWLPQRQRSAAGGRKSDGGRRGQAAGPPSAVQRQTSTPTPRDRATGTAPPSRSASSPGAGARVVANPAASQGKRRGPATCTTKPVSCSNHAVQPTANVISATPRLPPQRQAPGRSLSSSSVASAGRRSSTSGPIASLDNKLRERLKDIRLSKADISSNSKVVTNLNNCIREQLQNNSHRSLYNWNIMNSGSYYDKTKVGARRLCSLCTDSRYFYLST